ncbi:hypothetical protein LAJ19_20135 (plasmid) [Deinococcus taeanensis]|uniref:glycosyl-4,4'-diaponeurosporenoate acyltransferase CrtO family protein n=1 Tax=Deinococcus taeanensis TaxID=2737050 RepID=UPI001CDD1555|nr:hypothetical protein [Deinococcus taeanensis]UBV45438.1 hypothetical protein LAJ19_20135 [Deinococcus taeanensis]
MKRDGLRLSGVLPTLLLAWFIHLLLMASAAALLPRPTPGVAGLLPFKVLREELHWYRRLGIRHFNRLLEFTRWNRVVRSMRRFGGTRGELWILAEETWRSELVHGWSALTALWTALLLGRLFPSLAGWLLLLSVPLHLYPIMLQRTLRGRIQQLTGTCTH